MILLKGHLFRSIITQTSKIFSAKQESGPLAKSAFGTIATGQRREGGQLRDVVSLLK